MNQKPSVVQIIKSVPQVLTSDNDRKLKLILYLFSRIQIFA